MANAAAPPPGAQAADDKDKPKTWSCLSRCIDMDSVAAARRSSGKEEAAAAAEEAAEEAALALSESPSPEADGWGGAALPPTPP